MSGSTLQQIVRDKTVFVEPRTTVAQTIKEVREFTPTDDGASVYYVYVIDDEKLIGVVSLRELLNAVDSDPVSEVMTTELVTASTSDTLARVIRQIIDSRFEVLPVVDESERFVGVVRANDVIDALDEQTTKQLFKQAGFWMR